MKKHHLNFSPPQIRANYVIFLYQKPRRGWEIWVWPQSSPRALLKHPLEFNAKLNFLFFRFSSSVSRKIPLQAVHWAGMGSSCRHDSNLGRRCRYAHAHQMLVGVQPHYVLLDPRRTPICCDSGNWINNTFVIWDLFFNELLANFPIGY